MVTAALQGTTLAVEATFDGLASPVTKAELRLAQPGLRGPVQFTLTAPQTDSGKLAGSVTLTAVQVEQVRRGWFYLQLGTEVNPDGHLRGWLLPGGRL